MRRSVKSSATRFEMILRQLDSGERRTCWIKTSVSLSISLTSSFASKVAFGVVGGTSVEYGPHLVDGGRHDSRYLDISSSCDRNPLCSSTIFVIDTAPLKSLK